MNRMSRCVPKTQTRLLQLCSHLPRARTFHSLTLAPPSCTARRNPSAFRRDMLPFSAPSNRLFSIQQHLKMNTQELKNFLADSPPSTVNLVIKQHFDALTDQQARYAHYISRYEAEAHRWRNYREHREYMKSNQKLIILQQGCVHRDPHYVAASVPGI